MNLIDLGWGEFFSHNFEPFAEDYIPGRVAVEHKNLYRLYTERGEIAAEVSGRMRHLASGSEDLPAVGDWVAITIRDEEARGTIHHLLPRKSKFSRSAAGERTEEQIIAANVDTLFIVTGLDANFNLRRIERYLLLAWDSGANPLIVLNKADLCDDLPERIAETVAVALGVPIVAVSAAEGEGLDGLIPYLGRGRTAALVGSSGAGKSTITNQLVGRHVQQVQEVSDSVGKGKHTTTHRELLPLPSGGMLIDTPGMREVGLWSTEEGLEDTFRDISGQIDELAKECRFRNCLHKEERGCAIREALSDGTLDQTRYRSYQKMERELAYVARRTDQQAMLAEKERWKKLTKSVRGKNKYR